jgi:hypothetical protein
MDEKQLKTWLNVGGTRPLRQEIVNGMRDVPYPVLPDRQSDALLALLRCSPPRGESLFEPVKPPPAVMTVEQVGLWHELTVSAGVPPASPVRAQVAHSWLTWLDIPRKDRE